MSTRADRVLERVRATPPGFVRSYGDVSPGAPRFAGSVLFACEDPTLPWHRVVRADGSLAKGDRHGLARAAQAGLMVTPEACALLGVDAEVATRP